MITNVVLLQTNTMLFGKTLCLGVMSSFVWYNVLHAHTCSVSVFLQYPQAHQNIPEHINLLEEEVNLPTVEREHNEGRRTCRC